MARRPPCFFCCDHCCREAICTPCHDLLLTKSSACALPPVTPTVFLLLWRKDRDELWFTLLTASYLWFHVSKTCILHVRVGGSLRVLPLGTTSALRVASCPRTSQFEQACSSHSSSSPKHTAGAACCSHRRLIRSPRYLQSFLPSLPLPVSATAAA